MELQKIMLGVIALMVISLAATMSWGVGKGEMALPLTVFSFSLGFSLLFFEEWLK